MSVTDVKIDRNPATGERIVRLSIFKRDLDRMLDVKDILQTIGEFGGCDWYIHYESLVQSFTSAHKRRVAIEEGILGPITTEKQEKPS